MDVQEALGILGGAASRADLLELVTRRCLYAAVRRGEVRRVRRGHYALTIAEESDERAAAELGAVIGGLSAAVRLGWPVRDQPDKPWLVVPRGRKVGIRDQGRNHVRWVDLTEQELRDGLTSPLRTVLDCARALPFDAALAVADSALRSGDVQPTELAEAAAMARGPGSARVRRVAAEASPLAANPFESVLRATALDFPHLLVEPQGEVAAGGRLWHPDLVERRLRLALEADSYTFHTSRQAHARDCVRYNTLTLAGWTVLRFTWEQVMLSPAYVRSVLAEASLPAAA